MTDPIADRTAPGTWRIYDTDTARVGIDAGDDGPVVIYASRFSNKDFGGVYHEADARFIVYADRTIEAYEAVAEAARAQHYLYARDPNIERTDDDPAWCACGVPSDACGMLGLLSWLDIAKEARR